MKKQLIKSFLFTLTAASILGAHIPSAFADPANNFIVEGYYGDWMTKDIGDSNIQDLNILNYAFLGVGADGHIYLTAPNTDIGTAIPYNNGAVPFNNLSINYAIQAWKTGTLNYPAMGKDPAITTAVLGGKFKEIANLKRVYPNLKVLFSVGGWTGSTYFSDVAANQQYTNNFIQDIVSILQNFTYTAPDGSIKPLFDGVDIDWEYPVSGGDAGIHHSPEDGKNYAHLVNSLRQAFNANFPDQHFLITLAIPHGINQPDGGSISNIDFKDMFNQTNPSLSAVDHVNMMAYDYSNGLKQTSFLAPLNYLDKVGNFDNPLKPYPQAEFIIQGVNELVAAGVPQRSIVIGAPLYVSHWNQVKPSSKLKGTPTPAPVAPGLFLPANFVGNNTTYADFMNQVDHLYGIYSNPNVYFNPKANASYYYNPATGDFYSFDGPKDIDAKTDYIKNAGLGGIMFWEITGDTTDATSLMKEARFDLLGDKPRPATDPGSITFVNTDPKSWSNVIFNVCVNGSCTQTRPVAQSSLGLDPSNNSMSFKGYYGQEPMTIQIMVESSGTDIPRMTSCNSDNNNPIGSTFTLIPSSNITVNGYQSVQMVNGKKVYNTVCTASYPPTKKAPNK